MFMLLKRQIVKDRLEIANQEANKNHAHSPIKSPKSPNIIVDISYADYDEKESCSSKE